MEEENAERRRIEEEERAERQRLQEKQFREQAILREIEKKRAEQRLIDETVRTLEEKFRKAQEDLQRRQQEYLVLRTLAPSLLDFDCSKLEEAWNNLLSKLDPEKRQESEAKRETVRALLRSMRKRILEEELKKQALACHLPYVSPSRY
jgi:signal recognition particle GTPase